MTITLFPSATLLLVVWEYSITLFETLQLSCHRQFTKILLGIWTGWMVFYLREHVRREGFFRSVEVAEKDLLAVHADIGHPFIISLKERYSRIPGRTILVHSTIVIVLLSCGRPKIINPVIHQIPINVVDELGPRPVCQ